MVFWKNFRLSYISGTIWVEYIKYVTFEHFIRWSQSGARNQSWKIHDFVTMHTSNSIFVRFTCKMDAKIYFNYIYFLNLLYIYIYIYIYNKQHFYLAGYGFWTWAKPDEALCGNACTKWWPPKKGASIHQQLS